MPNKFQYYQILPHQFLKGALGVFPLNRVEYCTVLDSPEIVFFPSSQNKHHKVYNKNKRKKKSNNKTSCELDAARDNTTKKTCEK